MGFLQHLNQGDSQNKILWLATYESAWDKGQKYSLHRTKSCQHWLIHLKMITQWNGINMMTSLFYRRHSRKTKSTNDEI